MIIAAVGMPGSGKSVLCDHLREGGLPVIYFGGQVLDEVARRGLPVTPDNERQVREQLRAEHGMDAMAKLALPAIREHRAAGRDVVIDGLYSFSEYKTLRSVFGDDLWVVAVCAPAGLRHRRLATRPQRPLSPAEAAERDVREIERLEKGGPIAIADAYVLNDVDMAAFLARVDALMAERRAGRVGGESPT